MTTATFGRYSVSLVGGTVAAALLAATCYAYLQLGAYLDHIEGAVVVSGWEYAFDRIPLYQLQGGAPRFATFYGPLAYLVEGFAPLLLGPSIVADKLASMLAVLATVAIMARHFFHRGGLDSALNGLFYLLAGLLLFAPMSFWVRPDPFETLLVAAGVALAASPIALGLCIGLAVNFKIHAFVYFFPIAVEILAARQWRSLLLIAGAATVGFALPFMTPGISLHDYLVGLLQQVGGRHPSGAEIASVLLPAVLLALPVFSALLAQKHAESNRVYALATLVTLCLLFYVAAIPGAGPYHFLPLVPVLADALSRLKPRVWLAGIATLPLLLFGFFAARSINYTMVQRNGWGTIAADALTLARDSPTHAVQIGYGETRQSYDIAELNRAVLTLNGYPALIDAQVLMELGPIGVDGSRRWVAFLARCDVKRWLLPKGQKPFALSNFLYGLGPVFDPDFRRAFLDHYHLTASDRYFDVWDCDTPAHAPPAVD